MQQLKAGYFTSGINSLKTSTTMSEKVDALTQQLCFFDLDSTFDIVDTTNDSAIAVIYNIISRGTPTYASQFIEGILSTTIGKTLKRIDNNGDIYHEIQKDEVKEAVFKALHIIEPRIVDNIPLHGTNKDVLLNDFLYNVATPLCGDFITQIAETNRSYQDIFRFSPRNRRLIEVLKTDTNYSFLNHTADLSFCAPYTENSADSIVFSIDTSTDGIDHTDYIKEEIITQLLKNINIDGQLVIKRGNNLDEHREHLSSFIQNSYFDIIRQNYESPLYTTEDGIEALQIALTPPAAARIQKTVLEAINANVLNINDEQWQICVIERDVPCAFIAFEDLKQQFNNLFALENRGRKFPTIKLSIYYTPEFAETSQTLLYQGKRDDIAEFDSTEKFDLLIDIAMLQRSNINSEKISTAATNTAIIRSSKSPKTDTKLLFCNTAPYNIHIQKEDPEDFDEQEEALRFFLKNIFAKKDFKNSQIEPICQLLNGRSTLCVSPPGSGKTLIALFAAYLKPGYSLLLPPTISVMKMQFEMLRSRNIDTNYYINPILQNSFDRTKAAQSVTNGGSIVTFVSPSLLHDPYIRTIFRQIDKNNIPLYYIFVDEAQIISTQTPSFQPYYQDIKNIITRNFKTENTSSIRVGAFTSCQEYNVKNEIQQRLETDVTLTYSQKLSEMPEVYVFEISDDSTIKTDSDSYYRKLKQTLATDILQKSNNPSAIIYGAQIPYDLPTDNNSQSNYSYYLGDTDEKYSDITNSDAFNSSTACRQFCQSKTNTLVAVRSAGIGIHANKLKLAIHFEPPYSLDDFYRMNGRANKGMVPKSAVILNTLPCDFASTESVRDEKGNIKIADNITVANYDAVYNLKRLARLYPGVDKEKRVIGEILNGIIYPEKSGRETIIDAVFNEFGIDIETETEPMSEPYQLYIYTKNRVKSLGFINFKTKELNMPESSFDAPLAEKIQSYIFDIITNSTENVLAYLADMEKIGKITQEVVGIQNLADALNVGETQQITIPLYNGAFEEAAAILSNNLSVTISAKQLLRCYSQTTSFDEYEHLVNDEYNVNSKHLDDKSKIKYVALYHKFRNKRDTLHAIANLKEIDIIDDYLVDNANGEITATFTKHDSDYYKMKLLPILSRNLTRDKVLSYIASIDNQKYWILEKYTDVLIEFFYYEIYPLYQKMILDCNTFFKTVLEKQKNNTITQEMIAKNLNNYFVSRYNCKFIYQNISDNIHDINNILEILEQTGSNIGEMKHLEESLSQSIPENRTPSNKIICGYCNLFTNGNSAKGRFEAYKLISNGLDDYRSNIDVSIEKFETDTDAVTERIIAENYDLKDEMESVLKLELNSLWLRKFNSQILKI